MKRFSSALVSTLILAALALTACEQQPGGEPVARATIGGDGAPAPTQSPDAGQTIASQVESACRSVIFENTSLTHCLAIPSRHRIETALADDSGANYRSLAKLAEAFDADTVAFAVNAGMYDDEGDPVGYFVEDSERVQELATGEGDGNFYLQPNGVFFGTGDTWEVRTTQDFLAEVGDRPEFGTQSGPMLVIDGKIHPEITADGPSKLVRNAVGVDESGRAHFVIANTPLSFGKLARFFRDELKTPNALFLDGNVSALWNPATGRIDGGVPIGPILLVERKDPAGD